MVPWANALDPNPFASRFPCRRNTIISKKKIVLYCPDVSCAAANFRFCISVSSSGTSLPWAPEPYQPWKKKTKKKPPNFNCISGYEAWAYYRNVNRKQGQGLRVGVDLSKAWNNFSYYRWCLESISVHSLQNDFMIWREPCARLFNCLLLFLLERRQEGKKGGGRKDPRHYDGGKHRSQKTGTGFAGRDRGPSTYG